MVLNDKRFWGDLEVDYSKFAKDWDKRYKKSLKRVLNGLELEDITEVADSLDLTLSRGTKKDKVNELVGSDYALLIWLLNDFQKKKIKTIEEYCSSRTLSTKLPEISSKETPMGKISLIYSKQKELLKDIYVLFHRRSLKSRKRHESPIPIKQKHIDTLIGNELKLRRFLNKLDKENFKWKFYRATVFDDMVLFMFLKQIEDTLSKDIDRNRRKRTTKKCFIEFHLGKKDVEIIYSRYQDWRSLTKGLEKFLFPIPEKEEIFKDFDEALYVQFREKLCSESDQDDMKIVEVVFPQSELGGAPELHLTDKSRKYGLADAIQTLNDEEKIKIKTLYDITKLKIRFKNRTKEIIRRPIKAGVIELKLDDRGLDNELINKFQEKFKGIFGFPLNFPIQHPHRAEDLEKLLSNIFTKKQVFDPSKYEREIIKQIESIKIISSTEKYYCVCGDEPVTHKDVYLDPKTERCNICGAQIHSIKKVIDIHFSEAKIRTYLKKLLKDEGIPYENSVYTHKKESIRLISTIHKNLPCYFYVSCKPLPRKILDFFRSSSLPLIILNVGSGRISKKIQEYNLFKPVEFNKILILILQNNLPDNLFTNIIEEKSELLQDNIVRASSTSYTRVNEFLSEDIGYSEGDLEDDTFNLLRRIFPLSQKWGKAYSNRPLPEGIGGISFNDQPKGCFAWDCKLAENREGDTFEPHMFTRAEKRAGRAYIKNLCENKEITQYGSLKRLDSFILICNSINTTNFNNYAEYLTRTEYYLKSRKKWTGKVICLPPDVLLYLYRKYDYEASQPNFNQETFNKNLIPLFLKKKRLTKEVHYKKITKEDIDQLMAKYRSSLPSAPFLEGDNVARD